MQDLPNISRQVARTVAHEIRNPLTNINLSLDILEGTKNGYDPKLLYGIIRNNCKAINEQIANLLLSFSEVPVKLEKYSLNLVLDEVLEMAKDRIMLRRIKVEKNMHRNYVK